MWKRNLRAVGLLLLVGCSYPVAAEPLRTGGDTYDSNSNLIVSEPSPRDLFASGFNVDINSRVEKDLHAAGFDVDLNAPVGADAYAAGFSVEITEPVGDDLAASAFNVLLGERATVAGNARLAGGTIVVGAPIAGSLTSAAGDLKLNSTIAGDVQLTVGKMEFGTNAKINGKLTYYAREPIAIPATVISPDRVRYEKLEAANVAERLGETGKLGLPAFWPTFLGAVTVSALLIGFLVACGAVMLAFLPTRLEHVKDEALAAPVKMIALGILGLSMTFGLVPVSSMTLIGIPLVPIAILLIFVLWVAGYLAGAYAIGMRIFAGFRDSPATMGGKILAIAIAIAILALLNFIPIIGWLINLAVLFLGLGAMVMRAARHLVAVEPTITEVVTIDPVIAPPPPGPQVRMRRTRK